MAFSDDELERYARHIVLREIGGVGQQRLKAASVAVIGAGGLGAPALMYLAAAGVGRFTIVDDDVVSLSNLQRQVIFATSDVERPKVEAAAATLSRINPHVTVTGHQARLTSENATELLAGAHLVLDGCDNFSTRYVVNDAAVRVGIPLISGAISQWEGQISLFDPVRNHPCYACVFPTPPADGLAPSCSEAGVMGAMAGTVGTIMAGEAIKHITGAGRTLAGRLMIHDALWGESRVMNLTRRVDCMVCGGVVSGAP